MQICCAGEVMLEMAATGTDGQYTRGVAGDSFNTAVYLARAGLAVSYLTRLGDDRYSADIVDALRAENIDDRFITTCPGRQPGLYLIDNDPVSGERTFSYWREHAPARELFSAPLALGNVDVFYFTGITLAVTRADHDQLLKTLNELRAQGCRILFDPNYRAALWTNVAQAREHCRAVLPLCDTVLPTLEDDRLLWSLESASDSAAFYRDLGAEEVVVKGDELNTLVISGGQRFEQRATPVQALDTSGAGDAFNAGYLAARLQDEDVQTAVTQAQALAARVVQHRGAILPHES
ncbi:MAG: sugar kinase [Halioglobus sp.]